MELDRVEENTVAWFGSDQDFMQARAHKVVVIENYYYEGLSMREIAGLLKLTESRVCQIHSKVIKRLRELHTSKRTELFV